MANEEKPKDEKEASLPAHPSLPDDQKAKEPASQARPGQPENKPKETTIFELAKQLENKALSPANLSKEALKSCAELFKTRSYSNADIAQILGVAEKTVQRYLKDLREENAIVLSPDFQRQLVDEIIKDWKSQHSRLMKLSYTEGLTAHEVIKAMDLAHQVEKDGIELLERLGYLTKGEAAEVVVKPAAPEPKKEEPKKEEPKEPPIEVKKEVPKETPVKEAPQEVKMEKPKGPPIEVKRETPKEAPIEVKREAPKEEWIEARQEERREERARPEERFEKRESWEEDYERLTPVQKNRVVRFIETQQSDLKEKVKILIKEFLDENRQPGAR